MLKSAFLESLYKLRQHFLQENNSMASLQSSAKLSDSNMPFSLSSTVNVMKPLEGDLNEGKLQTVSLSPYSKDILSSVNTLIIDQKNVSNSNLAAKIVKGNSG